MGLDTGGAGGQMQVDVLGPLRATTADGAELPLGGRKQRTVLGLLALEHGRAVSVDRLVDAVWGDEPPAHPERTLQVYIANLRKVLTEPVLVTQPPGYVLDIGADALDLGRYAGLVRDGRQALADDRPVAAADGLTRALALWRGELCADLDGEFVTVARARWDEDRLTALEDRIAADLAAGRHADVVGELDGLVSAYPLRERLWEHLVLALYRCGRQADALAAYRRARDLLAEELGADPGPGLRQLESKVLAQDVSLAPRAPTASLAPVPCP